MNRFASLIITGTIASIATLAIAQTTDASTCKLYNTCQYPALETYQPQIQSSVNKHIYKTSILSVFIILVTTKIANTALESWLKKS